MRRADRLFRIVQILRRGRLTTARSLAGELEVAPRTIYRDIADLMASGVPVDGAAGTGYLLRPGFDLPPLMFTADELEALALGARMVAASADADLARAAEDALVKVAAVVPKSLGLTLEAIRLLAPPSAARPPITVDFAGLRRAVRRSAKIRLAYAREDGAISARTVWPLALLVFGPVWVLAAWCELRRDFRNFRIDRVLGAEILAERFKPAPGRMLEDYIRREQARAESGRPRARAAPGRHGAPAASRLPPRRRIG